MMVVSMRGLIDLIDLIVDKRTFHEALYTAFHGTSTNFRAFKVQKPKHIASYRLGFYFTDSPKYAEVYARMGNDSKPRIMQVALTINKPFDIHRLSDSEVIKLLPLPLRAKQELNSAFKSIDGAQYGLLEAGVRFGLRDMLEAEGYDGIIYREGPGTSYIVFYHNQVKTIRSTIKK